MQEFASGSNMLAEWNVLKVLLEMVQVLKREIKVSPSPKSNDTHGMVGTTYWTPQVHDDGLTSKEKIVGASSQNVCSFKSTRLGTHY